MKQESLELLGGFTYGVLKGITKTLVPPSKGFFDTVDNSIKSVSGAATVGYGAGEAVTKITKTLIFVLI